MIPIPAIIYSALTMKLQNLASELGEIMITAMGIPVLREGNILQNPQPAARYRRSLQRHPLTHDAAVHGADHFVLHR